MRSRRASTCAWTRCRSSWAARAGTRRPADRASAAPEHPARFVRCGRIERVAVPVERLEALGVREPMLDGEAGHGAARPLGIERDHLPLPLVPLLEHRLHDRAAPTRAIDAAEVLLRGEIDEHGGSAILHRPPPRIAQARALEP